MGEGSLIVEAILYPLIYSREMGVLAVVEKLHNGNLKNGQKQQKKKQSKNPFQICTSTMHQLCN